LAAVAGVARNYDNAGNTLAIGTAREFVYNAANRMSQAKQGGAVAMHYVYNGKGEQVRRHLGASDTTTVFDEAGRWLGDYDAAGTPLQQAVWLDDFPVGLLVGSSGVNRLHYVQPDHLGTPRAVIDPVRNLAVWNWDLASEAFGNSPPNEDPDGDATAFAFDMRFPGQRYDATSGLSYNYFRDYELTTGRYSQSDPLGLMAGVNTYTYVSGSPLVWADMYGLLQWTTNPIVWSPTLAPGLQTRTFPGDGLSTVTEASAARTTLDWSISAICDCSNGSYSLNEYSVAFTPIVFLRQSYNSMSERRASRRAELDHVRDLRSWIGSARSGAQSLEDSMKGQGFFDSAECEAATRQAMQQFLQAGARQAAIDSHNRWDASGRHTQVIPGPAR
ncbi:RHS repeat-associated core domain-containing protein, partial [Luteimonas sp. RD2P54]